MVNRLIHEPSGRWRENSLSATEPRMAANDVPVHVTDDTLEVLIPARGYALVVFGK